MSYAAAVRADQKPAPQPDSENGEQAPEDSPRSTVRAFFRLSRAGKYDEAAKYLELPPTDADRGAQLAFRLRVVLDRYVWIDLSKVSASPSGNLDDGLSQGVEEIARIPVGEGETEPVRLVRRGTNGIRWLFSRVTVQRVDGWYAALPHRWLLELAPEPLLRMGPGDLIWAQWCALPLFLLAIWGAGVGLSRLTRRVLRPFAKRTPSRWGTALLPRLAAPLTLTWSLLAALALVPRLGLYPPALQFAQRSFRALLFATFFWALSRCVDVAGQMLAQSGWGHGAPATRALLLFGSRVSKFFVAALALVALFSELGYSVTSLIAGLGVGGIAVALAAQKTLENVIGAFAIAVDQPFREGDYIKIDTMEGTVEMIGMRSTRIRTPNRTLVSIPNGKLADVRVENFAPRDRIAFGFTFGLTYATREAQVRSVLESTEKLLRDYPKVWVPDVSVRLRGLGEFALQIEVNASFSTSDWNEFTNIRQDVLLKIMAGVERAGAQIAYPTRTVQLEQQQPAQRPKLEDGAVQQRTA